MFNNKKGIEMGILIFIIVGVIALFVVLLAKGTFSSNEVTSTTQQTPGCKNSPKIPVIIRGVASAKNSAWIGSIASPDKVDIKQVEAGGKMLRAISNANFNWKISLIDSFTGNEVTSDSGNADLEGGVKDNPFRLTFFIKDNDCNGEIDDFEGYIVYSVKNTGKGITQTEEPEQTVTKQISFQNGRYVR